MDAEGRAMQEQRSGVPRSLSVTPALREQLGLHFRSIPAYIAWERLEITGY